MKIHGKMMKDIPIKTTRDHLSRIATGTSAIDAVAELIWNSLDAGANNVTAVFDTNAIEGIEQIEIRDDGCGIEAPRIEQLFGDLGNSWKKNRERFNNRPLHGKKGEGRFKAFSLGETVTWNSVYEDNGDHKHYRFSIQGSMVGKSVFRSDDPKECNDPLGTKVTIQAIGKSLGALLNDQTTSRFTVIFAGFLHRFPDVTICINGTKIVPDDYCKIVYSEQLTEIVADDGNQYPVAAEIIEWDIPVEREIQLCDDSGIELQVTDAKIQAKGENFTVRLRSDFFKILDQQNLLIIDKLSPQVQSAVEAVRNIARGYFRRKKAAEAAGIVQRWKAEKIYPFEDKSARDISPVELAERQVFDIIGVNVQDFLPDFEKADISAKKFTFRLLAQALKDNPESLQKILTEVLNLDQEKQKELAELLEKTDLTNIIKCAKTVSNRLNFLIGLENLVYDRETKNKLLERDQLHKIVENEAWIFDENFTLSASEATLNEVLQIHIDKLGKRCDDDTPVKRESGNQGRVDLLLGLAIRPREDEMDHLVVELKRPSKKIDTEVLDQARSYALAIAGDPRFDKEKTHWKVIAVSDEMDDEAAACVNQANLPSGLYFKSQNGNIEVWAYTWTQIIGRARAKLEFLNKSLCYEADRDSSKQYLLEKYEKFIPKVDSDETADSTQDEISGSKGEDANA